MKWSQVHVFTEGEANAKARAGASSQIRRFKVALAGFLERAMHEPLSITLEVDPRHGINQVVDKFNQAVEAPKRDVFYLLLVDSDGPVETASRKDYLQRRLMRDYRMQVSKVALEQQIHLMVQAMEAWFLADTKTLVAYYGKGFASNRIAKRPVEEISSAAEVLMDVTKGSQRGEYHKIQHAIPLLELISPEVIRKKCRYFDELIIQLEAVSTGN